MRVRGSHIQTCYGATPSGITIFGVALILGPPVEWPSWTWTGDAPVTWRVRVENLTRGGDTTVEVDGSLTTAPVPNAAAQDGDQVNVWLDALDSCGNVLAGQMGDYTLEAG